MAQIYAANRRSMPGRSRSAARKYAPKGREGNARETVGGISLSHPDRVYWEDLGVTKRELAEFYVEIWDWMRPHIVGRPIALVRCPEGAESECFFQKHATGIDSKHLHLVAEKGDKIISIDDLPGLISLVQAGVLELHTRGTTVDHREDADRLVFDLDPGPGIGWKDIVAAAREVRERLQQLKLETFLKTSGGKGLHVVLPIKPTPWDAAKEFARTVAEAMTADSPDRYIATVKKRERHGKIFVDYLRNSREATAVAPYSTRARPGAPVSVPISWSELGALKSADQYNVRNLPARLKRLRTDPWQKIGRLRPSLERWI
jgi:bifunctional non-homologous end joining protein LigD